MSPSRAHASSLTTTIVTSAARSNYRDLVLSRVYNAQFRTVRDFPDQLPRELVVALGSARLVASDVYSAGNQLTTSVQENTTQWSADPLVQTIDIHANSALADGENETWWNTAVWGPVYSRASIEHSDIRVL